MVEKENNDNGGSQIGFGGVNVIVRRQIERSEKKISVNHEHELEEGTGEETGEKDDVFIENDSDLELTIEEVWQKREEVPHHTPLLIIGRK